MQNAEFINSYWMYKITNTITGQTYIGITGDTIQARWTQHKYEMHKHPHTPLYAAMHYYGVEKFTIEEIEEFIGWKEFSEVLDRETHWMEHYASFYPSGYNLQRRKKR